jgi:hypothetical protein
MRLTLPGSRSIAAVAAQSAGRERLGQMAATGKRKSRMSGSARKKDPQAERIRFIGCRLKIVQCGIEVAVKSRSETAVASRNDMVFWRPRTYTPPASEGAACT